MLIHKQTLGSSGAFIVNRGATLLDAQPQNGALCLWYTVPPVSETQKISYILVPTGETVNTNGYEYFKTVQLGVHVWHIFVRRSES